MIIDWAYVGWGPIGHDAGHLALSLAAGGSPASSYSSTGWCEPTPHRSVERSGWDSMAPESSRSCGVRQVFRQIVVSVRSGSPQLLHSSLVVDRRPQVRWTISIRTPGSGCGR